MSDKKKVPFTIDDQEAHYILVALRAVRLYSKHKTVASLFEYLVKEETCNRAGDKLYWSKIEMKQYNKLEKKFKDLLKRAGVNED